MDRRLTLGRQERARQLMLQTPAHADGLPTSAAYTGAMKNLPSLLRTAAACALVAAPSLLYAADRAVPGQWEFTTTTDGTPQRFTRCMTAEDASQVNGDSASGRAAAEKTAAGRCTVESFTAAGSSVEYVLVCGPRRISSATVFHGDSSEGTLTTTLEGKATTSQVKARRLGACL